MEEEERRACQPVMHVARLRMGNEENNENEGGSDLRNKYMYTTGHRQQAASSVIIFKSDFRRDDWRNLPRYLHAARKRHLKEE